MKPSRMVLSISAVLYLFTVTATSAEEIEVFFSPKGGAAHAISLEIGKATKEILVASYSVNHPEIINSLVAASKKGVSVRMIVDKGQEGQRYTKVDQAKQGGVECRTDDRHQLFHSKYIVIDRTVVITGSMNHTVSGDEKNAENIVIIRNESVAKKFADNWQEHILHCRSFKAKQKWNYSPPSPPENLILPKK